MRNPTATLINVKWGNASVSEGMVSEGISHANEQYYHIRVIYESGGETSYFYELNKSKRLAENIASTIESLMPSIRFEGRRIFPKRIREYKIFVTGSPFEGSSKSLHDEYPNGYDEDFGGDDVTLEITTQVSREDAHYDKERLIKFLDRKWKGSKKCPICNINNWSLARYISHLKVFARARPIFPRPRLEPIMPVIALACTNCGYTMFFNPIEMGIFEDIFETSKLWPSVKGIKYTAKEEGNRNF